MDWENERYVRLYVRDTGDMLAIGWEGRAVLAELIRKVDRAGVMDEADHEIIAELLRMPVEVVACGFEKLRKRGVIEVVDGGLVLPNFIEAQEAKASDKQRQAESRGRRRDHARAGKLKEVVGSIYIAEAGAGPIKIGFATDVAVRLGSIRSSRPDGLTLVASVAGVTQRDEAAIHESLAPHRIDKEWYHPHEDVLGCLGRFGVSVTPRDSGNRKPVTGVTTGHDSSQLVTPSLAVPSRTEPSLAVDPSSPAKPARRQTPSASHDALQLAQMLVSAIAERQPESRPAREPEKCTQRWALDIDKLHRIDGRAWNRIAEVMGWCQSHHFWQSNILSGKKLREKFDTLESQMGQPNRASSSQNRGLSVADIARLAREAEDDENRGTPVPDDTQG